MTTLIIDEASWEREAVEVETEAFHHLFRVRRLRVGDLLRVVDGRGRARSASVERIDRRSARLSLGDAVSSNEPRLEVELLVAAPRSQRASWLVEKATETGVAAIRFVNTGRGPRVHGASTVARLRRVARSAVEQCGRSVVPDVTSGHTWAEITALVASLDRCWVLDVGRCRRNLEPDESWQRVGFVVGPEGGWETDELEELVAAGCSRAGLGTRVLRVETAAIVAAAALLVTPSVDTL